MPAPVITPPVAAAGALTLLAGNTASRGYLDANGPAARFSMIDEVVFDHAGNAYVTDDHTVRKISPAGQVSTVAGMPGQSGHVDGPAAAARFFRPEGIAVDTAGNVYVADTGNRVIRKVSAGGAVSTLAGVASNTDTGQRDGTGAAASFYHPTDIAIDAGGILYVADGTRIRKLTATGTVTTLVGETAPVCSFPSMGQQNCSYTDGSANVASLVVETLVAGPDGTIYFGGDGAVRKAAPDGTVTTLAGSPGKRAYADGSGGAARFTYPQGIALAADGSVFVTEAFAVRKVSPAGVVTTIAGDAALSGYADGPGITARFVDVRAIASDGKGKLLVADAGNYVVRKIASDNVVSTHAGATAIEGYADGTGAAASFYHPQKLAVDSGGTVYASDAAGATIRKITPGGVVTTLAGSRGKYSHADGTGSAAGFSRASDVTVDQAGNLYVADVTRIRKITPAGAVTTVAGGAPTDPPTPSIDGVGANARFTGVSSVEADRQGNILIVDAQTVRKLSPNGTVTTLAGVNGPEASVDGAGDAARFGRIVGITVDDAGNAFVAELYSGLIRKITPAGVVTTIAGNRSVFTPADGTGSGASFGAVTDITIDAANIVYVSESTSRFGPNAPVRNVIRRVTQAGVVTTIAGTPGTAGVALGSLPASFFDINGIAGGPAGVVYVASANAVLKLSLAP